ncbi:MAG: hypothetical protein WC846_02755 [Candidatus Gracilibacteria bacterium]|jgi:hypothetical protein
MFKNPPETPEAVPEPPPVPDDLKRLSFYFPKDPAAEGGNGGDILEVVGSSSRKAEEVLEIFSAPDEFCVGSNTDGSKNERLELLGKKVLKWKLILAREKDEIRELNKKKESRWFVLFALKQKRKLFWETLFKLKIVESLLKEGIVSRSREEEAMTEEYSHYWNAGASRYFPAAYAAVARYFLTGEGGDLL